jgi:uncharacterized protein (TIGR02453 family)
MVDEFRGFGPGVFEWFEGLEEDNSREYFAAHKATYDEEVRGGLTAMLEALADVFGGDVKMFRQFRDLRFSRDKSPYKTTTYGLIYDVPGMGSGLYAQLSARGLYAGTGYYRMSRDQLDRYRKAVDAEGPGERLVEEVERAQAAGLSVEGEGVRTAPRGYRKDHPRIDLLRKTSVIVGRSWDGAKGISREAALSGVAECWRSTQPLVGWFDEHVGAPEE